MSVATRHHFFVGTFNTPALYTLEFTVSPSSLSVVAKNDAKGSHSWLALDSTKTHLYATAWTTPPGLASYVVQSPTIDTPFPTLKMINQVETAARSGYVCCSDKAVYSAGGPTGEVFAIDPATGGFKEPIAQNLSFVENIGRNVDDKGNVLDFGGLRHGAHSADLSPDGRSLYIADIGRNCIWTYSVSQEDGSLILGEKHISPRSNDGPRHTWPHPSGKYLYSLQEHSNMVDVFSVAEDGTTLTHIQGVKIIPEESSPELYWADEVRLSLESLTPAYLFASTRGLEPQTKGYVAVFSLEPSGLLSSMTPLKIWETPTSGGWANAIEPAPFVTNGRHWLALTDSEKGLVMVLDWDGKEIGEVGRVKLDGEAGAATAVWID